MVVPYYTDESRVTLSPDTLQAMDRYAQMSDIEALEARVEALEAAQHTHPEEPDVTPAPAPAGGLVERVEEAIMHAAQDGRPGWTAEARAAIRKVAGWLREAHGWEEGAQGLEREANRG